MKKIFIILFSCAFSLLSYGQHELPTDTLRHQRIDTPQSGLKQMGDYLLDMRLLNLEPVTVKPQLSVLPNVSLNIINSNAYRSGQSMAYGTGYTDAYTNKYRPFDGFFTPFGWYGFGPFYNVSSNADMLRGTSITLKNGMHLNLYGKYDANGHLLPGMNAMPWQKHDFNAAFELKSKNGAFGFSVQVRREN